MKRGEIMQELREKLLRDNPCQAPVETSLPPLNSKLKFINTIEKNKVAAIELGAKNILGRTAGATIVSMWKDIAEDRTNLRNMFIDCNDTINEHKASKFRFKEIIRENTKSKDLVLEEMRFTKFEVEDYKAIKSQMEQFVSDYSIYEDFLRCVAQTGPEFNSVGNVLNRFESLEQTRTECAKLLQKEMDEANQMREDMQTVMENKNTELKYLSNKLIMLQMQQKKAKEQRMYWETLLHRIKSVMVKKQEENVVLGGGTWDLYKKMCARRKMPVTLDENDIERQIEFVKNTILFYKEVNTIASGKSHDVLKEPEKSTRTTVKRHTVK